MNSSDRIQQLLQSLAIDLAPTTLDALAARLARNPDALAELAALSSAWQESPSDLLARVETRLACAEAQEDLDSYVEAQLAGNDVTVLYPTVTKHIAQCSRCQEQVQMLSELLTQQAAGRFGRPPTYLTFREQLRQTTAPATLWQTVRENLYQLAAEFKIVFAQGQAAFAELPALLAPRLTTQTALGTMGAESMHTALDERTGAGIELLELPHPQANLVVKVSTRPTVDQFGTLIIRLATLTPPHPLAEVKVSLRDQDDQLLESAPTDEDGLALFQALEMGQYTVQIDHHNQSWLFKFNFTETA